MLKFIMFYMLFTGDNDDLFTWPTCPDRIESQMLQIVSFQRVCVCIIYIQTYTYVYIVICNWNHLIPVMCMYIYIYISVVFVSIISALHEVIVDRLLIFPKEFSLGDGIPRHAARQSLWARTSASHVARSGAKARGISVGDIYVAQSCDG